MIPRKFRLTGRRDIEKIKKTGNMIQSASFALIWLSSGNESINPRFGIIVSKKISTKATVRNKVKRSLRYILMQLVPQIKRGYDLMFLTKKNILDLDMQILKKEMETLLKKESIMI